MRIANQNDIEFLAESMVKISCHMKAGETDVFIEGLPFAVDDATREIAAHFIDNTNAIALIAEAGEKSVACLLGEITCSSFSPANLGRVGYISVCWVEAEHRKVGIAGLLVRSAENWFREKGVGLVEVSFMAKNQLAAAAWEGLGYDQFRVFSYKKL